MKQRTTSACSTWNIIYKDYDWRTFEGSKRNTTPIIGSDQNKRYRAFSTTLMVLFYFYFVCALS